MYNQKGRILAAGE